MATLHLIPTDIAQTYEVHEWRNAAGVLSTAHPTEWQDVIEVLRAFEFRRSEVLKGGGRKSVIARRIDSFLEQRGWKEKKFATKIRVDDEERDSPAIGIHGMELRCRLPNMAGYTVKRWMPRSLASVAWRYDALGRCRREPGADHDGLGAAVAA
jgi:Restriction endonuclease BglII